jgi:hypothetical protein
MHLNTIKITKKNEEQVLSVNKQQKMFFYGKVEAGFVKG